MGEKGNPLASMTDIPDYIASLSAAYTVYQESQARKEDRAEREVERAGLAAMEAEHTAAGDHPVAPEPPDAPPTPPAPPAP
jgi:hypothetical protein